MLEPYGLRSTRITPGRAHETGVAEQAHYRTKSALKQALVLRGSRDFPSVEAYEQFVQQEGDAALNVRVAERLDEERPYLRPLPAAPVPAYSTYRVRVRRWSTIRVSGRSYSVPSRLICTRSRCASTPIGSRCTTPAAGSVAPSLAAITARRAGAVALPTAAYRDRLVRCPLAVERRLMTWMGGPP